MGVEDSFMSPPQALLERLKDYVQEEVFALWDDLSSQEQQSLVADIEVTFILPLAICFCIELKNARIPNTWNWVQSLDLSRIDRIIRCSLRSQGDDFLLFYVVSCMRMLG